MHKKRDVKIKTEKNCGCGIGKCCKCQGAFGGIYFLGFIGSAIYYIQTATSFSAGVFGFLKALVWPAFLVYKLLGI